ncbi:hypothetical protein HPB52_011170 [Rhipicephalus sanguineus]|uniref:Transposable element P transposase-like GTP-binding insertion domain-containing protein n=1 Tax=Rhipicephalus sanguineus TaxID=34632 RepID=A0A9D4Q680_RHISA|nr:hypothetical protein HPB52_011170 [Rhipicephalus sanguineus]
MNVRLAVQLLSRSVATGLKVYKRLQHPGLEDSDGTAQFTSLVNDLFDALNVKLPRFGIRSSSNEIEVIGEFLRLVNVTEQNHIREGTVMFASQVTMESLRVTLASVLDLIRDLLSKGAQYVLTGKLNQDPLEVADDAPSPSQSDSSAAAARDMRGGPSSPPRPRALTQLTVAELRHCCATPLARPSMIQATLFAECCHVVIGGSFALRRSQPCQHFAGDADTPSHYNVYDYLSFPSATGLNYTRLDAFSLLMESSELTLVLDRRKHRSPAPGGDGVTYQVLRNLTHSQLSRLLGAYNQVRTAIYADDIAIFASAPRNKRAALFDSVQYAINAVDGYISGLRNTNRNILCAARGLIARGRGCTPKLALRVYNGVATARVIYGQWAELDAHHRAAVRTFYGLPSSTQIGPTLAEAGEMPISLRAVKQAFHHLLRMKGTTHGQHLSPVTFASNTRMLVLLRIGCHRAAERLHRLSGRGSPYCSDCGDTETLQHLLLHCPAADTSRTPMLAVYARLGLPRTSATYLLFPGGNRDSVKWALSALLDFLDGSGLRNRI